MKPDIHPNYKALSVSCACGNTFSTHSTLDKTELKLDVCNACHPFYTGKHKIIDTAGRVEKFMSRYGNYQTTSADTNDATE